MATQNRAHRPQRSRSESKKSRDSLGDRDIGRIPEGDQPGAAESRGKVPGVLGHQALPEQKVGTEHSDHRLQLLYQERGCRISVGERLGEEDRRDSRRPGTDKENRCQILQVQLWSVAQKAQEQR